MKDKSDIIDQVVQDEYKLLYRCALSWTYNVDDAQDLVQDAIMKALTHKEQFKEGNKVEIKKWLYTILRNSFINTCRTKSYRQDQSYDEEDKGFIKDRCESKEKFWTGEYEDLIKIIDSINVPIVDKRCFLGYYNGYLYEEIAQILEISLGTVKSKIHYIRKKIIKEYGTKY